MMNKFPYIAESSESGVPWLIYSEDLIICLGHEWHKPIKSNKRDINDFFSKSITAEHLSNTHGKVESKEHAEFIKLLAESNGMGCSHKVIDEHCNFFYVIDGCLFFSGSKVNTAGNYKLITIPLPPNNTNTPEEDFEMTQIAKNNGDNLLFGGDDKVTSETVVAGNGKAYDVTPLSEWQGDEVKFRKVGYVEKWPAVGDEAKKKCITWPAVGDKVLTTSNQKAVVKSVDGEMTWIKYEKETLGYATEYICALKKPKTPEEELREKLYDFFINSRGDLAKAIFNGEIEGLSYKPQ